MTMLSRRAVLAALGSAAAMPAFAQSAPTAVVAEKTIAEQLADYAGGLRYSDLPPAVVEATKAHFIDAMGCAIGAFNEPSVSAIRNIALAAAGSGATVLGTKQRTTVDWASFANGAATRYFDLNDVYAGREVGHPSDNITPCLAVAEAEGRSGQDLILAIALAYEIDCRLLDTVQISSRGWDHPNFSLPAAALGAGRLMRLSPSQLTEAVNLSLAGHLAANQTRLQVISNWKGLADAEAGRAAIFAAQLARAGITGPAPAFEGKAGFFSQVSGPFAIDIDKFGHGEVGFKIVDCSVKAYPAQALLQTAIVAAARIGAAVPDTSKIKSIVIATSLAGQQYAADSKEKWLPETSETADHSLPYIVAKSLLDHEITNKSYSKEALHDPRLRALLSKVTVEEDPALTKLYPQKIPNRVSVTLDDGRVLTEQVEALPGFGGTPITRTDVEDKFRRNVKTVWPEPQLRDFLAYAWELDRQDQIAGLFDRMVVGA
jgi:2-methylcitrate dehydratase